MTAMTGSADRPPDCLAATRDGLHRVAEHILAAARYAATGKIGLIPSPGDMPGTVVLWPEHFDVGMTAAINYGVSPGDEHITEPYLYVGPRPGRDHD